MVGTVLRILALICFVFATFGFNPFGVVTMLPLGLAFWVGGELAGAPVFERRRPT